MPEGTGRTRRGATSHRWRTFLRNHASVLLASDFCVVVTARFRVVYVFVVMEIGSRRLVHVNVTNHPTAAWTLQQCREVLAEEHPSRFVLHDRDSIYAPWLDALSQRWASASSGRRSKRQRRTRFVSVCSAVSAASAWIS
jgi:hypothetical protein